VNHMNLQQPAAVRVFLCTYRRNQLLRRSLQSLLGQAFADWTCELHNDAPDDPFPATLAAEFNDSRIVVVNHEKNLGAVGTFNLMFEPRPERYVTLLEDDNWWDSKFLETMVAAMNAHPNVKVGWSNVRFWRQEENGTWTDLKRNVWDRPQDASVELIQWPNYQQADAALHSNGAMLIRSGDLADFKTPGETMFEFVEPVRERAMPHPLLFVPQPLVNFSITLDTARDKGTRGRLEHYVLLLASFFKHEQPDDQMVFTIWEKKRHSPIRSTHNLILAGLSDPHCRKLLRYAKLSEWVLFFLIALKHLGNFVSAFQSKSRYPELWTYLDKQTQNRSLNSGARAT
jgi:glycosyltransferase involved in cell wall biosynthesis